MSIFDYYKNNPTLLTWTIVIFLVCAVIGVASICIRKWLRNRRLGQVPIVHAIDKDYQFSDAETDGEEAPDAIEIYEDDEQKK